MRTRAANITVSMALWLVTFLPMQWFVGWVHQSFDLSTAALYVLYFLSGLMLGVIAGFVYIELECRRKRRLEEQAARVLEEQLNLAQWAWRQK